MQSHVEGADVLSGSRAAVLRLGELQSALSEERVLIAPGIALEDLQPHLGIPQPGARGW
jgi:hypothetical protein